MGPARHGSSHSEPDRPDRGGAPIGFAELGFTSGIAGEARPGNLGRARGAARFTGADLGLTLARRPAGAGRYARAWADVGIAGPGRRPSTVRARTELGCACARSCTTTSSARSGGAGVGRVGRTRTSVGCAAGRASASGAGTATSST